MTSQARLSELPDIPTLAEAGLGTIDVRRLGRLRRAQGHAATTSGRSCTTRFPQRIADPAVREQLEKNTMQAAPPSLGPAAFGAFLAKDVAKWARTIQDANIKAE